MVNFTLSNDDYEVVEAVDGIELIKQTRTKQQDKFMPIVMLTTESQDRKDAGR